MAQSPPRESRRPGTFVSLPEAIGLGKLVSLDPPHATVRLFHSLAEHEDRVFPISGLRRAHLSPGTRVYVRNDTTPVKIGRVVDFDRRDDGSVSYEVRFPNQETAEYAEADLHVRCWRARGDPAEILAACIGESQWLHDRRLNATQAIVDSQSGAKGMTALLSSGIELVPHQIAAVRRILCDPLQRYLLADEVGLGKTVEAGVIIRQCLLDDPERYVVVLVPGPLVPQWKAELSGKFNVNLDDRTVDVLPHEEFIRAREVPDLLVVDEAHHIAESRGTDLSGVAHLAHNVPRLLLLSATPALADARKFLFLLNLLDCEAYKLENLEAFEAMLLSRREFGRLLLGLSPEGSPLVLRRRAQQAAELFPQDPAVIDLSRRLQEAAKVQSSDVPELTTALKTHIAETYRVNQRILRGRRSDTAGWEFQPRGAPVTPDRPLSLAHLRVEVDEDRRMPDLASSLEDWRTSALGSLTADAAPEQRMQVAMRFRRLVEALGVGVEEFVQEMEREDQELFSGEDEIRRAIDNVLRTPPGERGKIDVAADCLHRLHKSITGGTSTKSKILAYSSSTRVARAVFERMTYGVAGEIFLLTASDTPEAVEQTLRDFERRDSAWLLVTDRAGEEGLNLSFADAMLQIDLPFSPARIEQRIGRIDRFGRRTHTIRQRILLPFDDEGSVWSAWQTVLAEAFLIYNESISDVQFLLERIEREFTLTMFERGASGIEQMSVTLRQRILAERQAQDEQHALDRFAVSDDLADGIVSSIESLEDDEDQYRGSIEPWLVDALQLSRSYPSPTNRDVFSLRFDGSTLVPRDPWQKEFGLDGSRLLTWKRRIALDRPGVQLLRPGSKLLDACDRFMRWDDRGTTFLTWRVDPTSPDGDLPWLAFRVCVSIQPRLPQGREIFARADAMGAWRRAQQFLAKSYHVVHVDADGELITNPRRLEILRRPYVQQPAAGRFDINMGSRLRLLRQVMDPAQLQEMCGRVARDAVRDLLASDEIQSTFSLAAKTGRQDGDRRNRRLRARAAWAGGEAGMAQELAINDEIAAAVADPSVRLDAIGLFVVNSKAPEGVDGTA